ncbi:TPA: restriction endonuclease subunit S [Streptococcus suis]|nr:restriction endonuclease subunit S [Streptococcus suis]
MTKEKSTVPRLRFPGFTDAWKQRKLGEVGYAKSGVGFPEKEQGGTTGIPFFKVSDMNTNGNENELVVANNYVTDEQISKRKWRVITEVPAIFFAKVGAAVMLNRKRLIRHPFLLDNNTMAYVFNHIQWETNFGKILFETIDLTQLTQVGALPSYNSSDVENINISLPTLPEQEAIGSFFSDLDQLITLHQRKLDDVKELKKALLQKMFPKGNGNDFPELRFPEFTDAWKQRKAMEIFKVVSDKGYADLPILSASQELGMIRRDEIGIDIKYDKEAVANYKRVLPGQFVIHLRSFQGGFAWSEIEGLTSPAYTILDFKEENSSKFWRNVLTSPNFIKKLETVTYGIRDGRSISYSDFSTLNFVIPTLPEQEAIGSFFSDLDQLITLHQRQLDHLKLLKKALLQQMFI